MRESSLSHKMKVPIPYRIHLKVQMKSDGWSIAKQRPGDT